MTKEECIAETKKHIAKVEEYLDMMAAGLKSRGHMHDLSKTKSPELEIFQEYTDKLKGTTFGSAEYKQYLKEMKPALDHHYKVNRHHPESNPNGIKGMNLLDVMEMVCDWKAASERHANGDIVSSIEKNKERFDMSDDLTQIILNTVKLL